MIIFDRPNRIVDQLFNAVNRQAERSNRAFQPLEKVDTHKTSNAFFTSLLGQAVSLVVRHVDVLCQLRWHDIIRRRIDHQTQRHEQIVNIVIVDRIIQIGQAGTQRNRRQTLRKFADVRSVVILFNVLS